MSARERLVWAWVAVKVPPVQYAAVSAVDVAVVVWMLWRTEERAGLSQLRLEPARRAVGRRYSVPEAEYNEFIRLSHNHDL